MLKLAGGVLALFVLLGTIGSIAFPQQKEPSVKAKINKQQTQASNKETKIVKTTESIAFSSVEKSNGTLDAGIKKVTQQGKNGQKEITYKVTYENDKEINREKVNEVVSIQPVDQVTSIGTKRAPPKVEPKQSETSDVTVYITRTGEKYHVYGCRYLRQSRIPTSLSSAKSNGYTPCSVCDPPT